jgi:inosine-uridine nucleoside N-ribohydrolase
MTGGKSIGVFGAALLSAAVFGGVDGAGETAAGIRTTVSSPVKIIFDTDMYTDFDDIGALACLHALADSGECEILATVACTRESMSVAVCEIVNAFCGRPEIPVGCVRGTGVGRDNDCHHRRRYGKVVDRYAKWVRHRDSDDAPDAAEVYRRVLSAQPDRSVVICPVGFLSNMAKLVETDRDLVERKVRLWVAMACRYPHGREYNSAGDIRSSHTALEKWPTPIMFCDFDYGKDCYAGRVLIPESVGDNPVSDVFRASAGSCNGPGGRSAWDQVAVLAAVRGTERYFNVERGTYRMRGDEGDNVWIRGDGNCADCRITGKMDKREVGRIIDGLMLDCVLRRKSVERAASPPRKSGGT